jgi:cell division septum initiation protein DivIVA
VSTADTGQLEPKEGDVGGQPDDTEHAVEEVTPFAQPSQETSSYADVGDAVTGVLRAAQEAAEKIRSDAENHAREVVERAHGEASARIEELTREAKRARSEADDYAGDVRSAVDSYATQQRREADEEARRIVEDAEEQARATREAAQAMADQQGSEARSRYASLRDEVRALDERRTRITTDLRELAAQLNDLVPEPSPTAHETELLDALEVERRS